MDNEKNLGVSKLALFAIGTTLASGVFSLSGDFAASGAYTLAVLIGWAICGIGMFGLTMAFFKLSVVKPGLTSGVYKYAKEGFGEFMGFEVAWGYWLSALLAQLSFIALLFAAIGNFFPVFGAGNNFISLACASVFVWLLAVLVLRGVNESVGINAVVVIAKIIPILVTVVAIVLAGAFDLDIFMQNFKGVEGGLSLMDQVVACSYTSVWIFIGIEGAVVISGRAKNTKIAGKATMVCFASLFALYFIISILSMGVMPAEELAALENPPMAGVVGAVVGPWAEVLVNIAVIISLGGAMFTYMILCIDSLYAPAKDGALPPVFAKVNKHNAPTWSVLLHTIVVQAFIVIMYFSETTYQAAYALSTSGIMVPYVTTALYFFKLMCKGEGLEEGNNNKVGAWIIAIIAVVYGAWLMYASGLTYILAMAILYAPGVIMFVYHKKQQGKKLFETTADAVVCAVLLIAFVVAVWALATGRIAIL